VLLGRGNRPDNESGGLSLRSAVPRQSSQLLVQ
jgi:hypothetical protein